MRAIRPFEEYIKDNVVKKQAKDMSRAEYLLAEAGNGYDNLLEKVVKIGLTDSNANDFVKSCYDILMQLLRAKMLLEGYNASGAGAHEAEVSYMRRIGFCEADIQFADQIRYFRNGILYYGKKIDAEYAGMVIEFTKNIYCKLKK